MKKKHNGSNNSSKEEKQNKDLVIVNGTVVAANANAMFDVLLDNDRIIRLPISGKIRMNKIRINPGDRVQVGINIYDMNRGRILYRLKEVE